jgi:hypothetical protein
MSTSVVEKAWDDNAWGYFGGLCLVYVHISTLGHNGSWYKNNWCFAVAFESIVFGPVNHRLIYNMEHLLGFV